MRSTVEKNVYWCNMCSVAQLYLTLTVLTYFWALTSRIVTLHLLTVCSKQSRLFLTCSSKFFQHLLTAHYKATSTFFSVFILLLIGGQLLYNIVLVSAVQQCESAVNNPLGLFLLNLFPCNWWYKNPEDTCFRAGEKLDVSGMWKGQNPKWRWYEKNRSNPRRSQER